MTYLSILHLREAYAQFRQDNPKARIRDAARQMGVSEAELVASGIGDTATRLEDNFSKLLELVHTLGEVMALTRNDACVHERHGQYLNVSFEGPVGMALGEDIDLRLFMMHWKFGFAVNESGRRSLQFFDKSGAAVHKIYLTDKSDTDAYGRLVLQFHAHSQMASLDIEAYVPKAAVLPDREINVSEFQQAWLAMQDTHEFFGLLKKYQVARTQGLRLAPEGHAWRISTEQVKAVFHACAKDKVPMMVFVGNRGCLQIHTGLVQSLVQTGPWFNVLDPMFNMHLSDGNIAEAWVVLKPTADGIVTGIELFDREGETIAYLFGKRKPGRPELPEWRAVVHEHAQPSTQTIAF